MSSVAIAFFVFATSVTAEDRSPEQRAVAFLSAEVPRWQQENNCYSCHNNGDAARALMLASSKSLLTDRAPLEDTLRFLRDPATWDANGPEGPFKDKKLARIQFASALATAQASGLSKDCEALQAAAELLAELQSADGSWEIDGAGAAGSPATYGQWLATAVAVDVLEFADGARFAGPLQEAYAWFGGRKPRNVPQAAAKLVALRLLPEDEKKSATEIIRKAQGTDGGWGPFVTSPSEPFDTALVLLALVGQPDAPAYQSLIARGREYLIGTQEADGGWPPTTRPSGADSYAQRISTTGWATLALLATDKATE